jgi:CspA family cold shock protein
LWRSIGNGRHKGKVLWFNNDRGFGFIVHDGPDVFVESTAIQSEGDKTLREGDDVEFDIVKGPKGTRAANVVKLLVQRS